MTRKEIFFLIVLAGLITLCGISNGVVNSLQFRYNQKSFLPQEMGERFLGGGMGYWHPDISWRNKYKDRQPNKGPAFFGSTTFLVFLTDAFHLFDTIMATSWQSVVALILCYLIMAANDKKVWWWFFIILAALKLLHGAGFHLIYTIL